MGSQSTIDIRLWGLALVIAFWMGRMDVFGIGGKLLAPFELAVPRIEVMGDNGEIASGDNNNNSNDDDNDNNNSMEASRSSQQQQFVMDFKGTPTEHLQSKDYLIESMTTAARVLDMELISAHCQDIVVMNSITCLAVLDQGQISIQAWPPSNVLSVDLIRVGSKSLISNVPALKQAFGVQANSSNNNNNNNSNENGEQQQSDDDDDQVTFWSLDHRGEGIRDRYAQSHWETASSMVSKIKDLVLFLEEKEGEGGEGGTATPTATSMETHQLEIWDMRDIDDSLEYQDAIEHNLQPGDPRWTNNALARTSRDVYLDGVPFATNFTANCIFREMLVHPALMTQENPKRVAILGGSGNILSEVLKCHHIESVTWLQPNQKIIYSLQKYIPEIYDCSDLEGRSDMSCLDDPRLQWIQQDAKSYFVGGRGDGVTADEQSGSGGGKDDETFDVIWSRMDRPNKADDLNSHVASVLKQLAPDGAWMLSLGFAPTILHPRADVGHFAAYERLFQTLEHSNDVESMMVFEEDFMVSTYTQNVVPDTFLLVCKSAKCRERFQDSRPETIDSEISKRYISRRNKPVLEYYDGAVHSRIQVPPKAYETIYCRREPTPVECEYLTMDFSKPIFEFDEDVEKSAFEVTDDGVVATLNIPEGSYILAKDLASSLRVPEASLKKDTDSLDAIGKISMYGGEQSWVLELGIAGRIRRTTSADESNVACWFCDHARPKYSPVHDRRFGSFDTFLVATKAISKGEELVRLV